MGDQPWFVSTCSLCVAFSQAESVLPPPFLPLFEKKTKEYERYYKPIDTEDLSKLFWLKTVGLITPQHNEDYLKSQILFTNPDGAPDDEVAMVTLPDGCGVMMEWERPISASLAFSVLRWRYNLNVLLSQRNCPSPPRWDANQGPACPQHWLWHRNGNVDPCGGMRSWEKFQLTHHPPNRSTAISRTPIPLNTLSSKPTRLAWGGCGTTAGTSARACGSSRVAGKTSSRTPTIHLLSVTARTTARRSSPSKSANLMSSTLTPLWKATKVIWTSSDAFRVCFAGPRPVSRFSMGTDRSLSRYSKCAVPCRSSRDMTRALLGICASGAVASQRRRHESRMAWCVSIAALSLSLSFSLAVAFIALAVLHRPPQRSLQTTRRCGTISVIAIQVEMDPLTRTQFLSTSYPSVPWRRPSRVRWSPTPGGTALPGRVREQYHSRSSTCT